MSCLETAGDILVQCAQRALLTVGRRVARGWRASCGIIRIAIADVISCPGTIVDDGDFAVLRPNREYLADSLCYHFLRIAIHWIVHADCRVKGCVNLLFQFIYLG